MNVRCPLFVPVADSPDIGSFDDRSKDWSKAHLREKHLFDTTIDRTRDRLNRVIDARSHRVGLAPALSSYQAKSGFDCSHVEANMSTSPDFNFLKFVS
ncbi:hypothetical protein SAMN06265222_101891 [Neorhodopirellula lusitana]|uniref:Uncharacterized protein n=1 Tax=Neorhodopirellula lusitana TaxID=445327 RepID=A0ABY1PVB8_9BACT|nr:hypothetical protein SAMN06265222_101891 [Neorhodopirellula lusitana]